LLVKFDRTTYPGIKTIVQIFLFWSIVAIFFVVQNYVQAIANDRPFPVSGYSIHQLSNFWLWALFTPMVFKLVDYIKHGNSRIKKVSGFLLSGSILSILHSFVFNLISIELRYTILEIEQLKGYLTFQGLLPIAVSGFFSSFLTFILLTGAIYAWRLTIHNREQEALNARLEANLSQTRLQALKGQLHPHFLFNTLNSISTLTEINPSLARQMISKLSGLLRYSLDHTNRQFASVREEIEVTRKYLEIEQVRFGDRLTVSFDIDSDIEAAKIPFLLLQPLVENSIIHGISPHRKKGLIEISCNRQDDYINISISDNGKTPKILDDSLFEKGMGLSLTKKRLTELYGSKFDMKLEKNVKEGLTIQLLLPFELFRDSEKRSKPIEVIETESKA